MTFSYGPRLLTTSLLLLSLGLGLSACNSFPNPFANSADEGKASTSVAVNAADVESTFQSGVTYSQSGQWEQAIEEYKKVLAADPNYASAYANLGWAYAETSQFDKAIEPLHKAITLEPNNAAAHANLAWAYAGEEQWSLAVQEAEKATALDTTNPYAYATLGWALMETGQDDKAIAAYGKAIGLKGDLDSAHFALGSLYCQKKQPDVARQHLQHLQELGSPRASELSEEINKGCA